MLALARYDRVTAGMTAAATEAALGGPGDAGPGDEAGGFLFERVDTFAVAESGTARRYWRLPDGLVVVERTSAGKIIGKMLLTPADVRPPAQPA